MYSPAEHAAPLPAASLLAALLLALGCGGAADQHGQFSALTANAGEASDLCEHRIPAEACVKCNPALIPQFKAVKDWCGPHRVPESQCYKCHPSLSFEPLPEPPEGADLREVPPAEALAGLAEVLAPGKVTVVDFWAAWCVPCRQVAGDLNLRLAHQPDLAVRKVEIKDWDDPLAARYLGGATALPLLVVYDAAGEEVGRVSGHRPDELDALLAKAAAR